MRMAGESMVGWPVRGSNRPPPEEPMGRAMEAWMRASLGVQAGRAGRQGHGGMDEGQSGCRQGHG